jgi:tripartite-type tricarboxylate transporter receptor subunit TctC
LAAAKKALGALKCRTSGNGSAPHMGAANFSKVMGVHMAYIPEEVGATAVAATISGDAPLTFVTPPSVLPMVTAGRLKAIGVTIAPSAPRGCPAWRRGDVVGIRGLHNHFWSMTTASRPS